MYYIGVDLGTTNIKAAVYTDAMQLVDRQSFPVAYLREENRVYRQNAEAAKRSPVQGAAHPGGDDPESDPFLTGFNGSGW